MISGMGTLCWVLCVSAAACYSSWIYSSAPSALYSKYVEMYERPEYESVAFYEASATLSAREKEMVARVKASIKLSKQESSKLTPAILNMEGMSNTRVRHLLNNLCSKSKTRYLEIGCWKGSTFVSALYGNHNNIEYAAGIDNWSKFGGPVKEFQSNCQRFLTSNKYEFYSANSFEFDLRNIKKPITVYFYDGDHQAISQEMAFTYYDSVFQNTFIAVVDDWSGKQVREGTFKAFNKLNYQVLWEAALPRTAKNERGQWSIGWFNGFYVAVIRKSG